MDEKNGFLELGDGEETEEGLLDFEFEELSQDDPGAGGEDFDTEEILELTDIAEPMDDGGDDVAGSGMVVDKTDEDAAAGHDDEFSFELDALEAEIEESLSTEGDSSGEEERLGDENILADDAIEDGEEIEDITELEPGPAPVEAEMEGALSEEVDLEAIMGEVEEFDEEEIDVDDQDIGFEGPEEIDAGEAEPLAAGVVTEEQDIPQLEPEAVEPAFEPQHTESSKGTTEDEISGPLAGVSEERLEAIVRRTVQEVVEKVAREAMMETAEKVIRESIDALKSSIELSKE